MKKLKRILSVLLLGAAVASGCSKSGPPSDAAQSTNSNRTVQYTCPMHPEVVQSSPGNCPKCGMKLVEKR